MTEYHFTSLDLWLFVCGIALLTGIVVAVNVAGWLARRSSTPPLPVSSSVFILDVARFGPRMTWEEVQTALRDRREDAVFRAVAQVLEYQRQRCQVAVQDKTNLPDGQMAFEAGAAASAADMLAMITEIADEKCADSSLKAWFGGQIRTKQD